MQRSRESGVFSLAGVVPATSAGALPGDSAAEIALAADGRYAYVGVRGSNRISVLEVDPDGGALRPVADVPSGGDWPRHHLVRDGWLHVAHERSGDVVTYPLDPESGIPGEAVGRLEVLSPTALVPRRCTRPHGQLEGHAHPSRQGTGITALCPALPAAAAHAPPQQEKLDMCSNPDRGTCPSLTPRNGHNSTMSSPPRGRRACPAEARRRRSHAPQRPDPAQSSRRSRGQVVTIRSAGTPLRSARSAPYCRKSS